MSTKYLVLESDSW